MGFLLDIFALKKLPVDIYNEACSSVHTFYISELGGVPNKISLRRYVVAAGIIKLIPKSRRWDLTVKTQSTSGRGGLCQAFQVDQVRE